jgi:hypothetical protein
MRPIGYLYKDVASRPGWLHAPQVTDVYSLSGCVSTNFADYISYWKHNGYWLFDSPLAIRNLAAENTIVLDGLKLFYYEVFEEEFYGDSREWRIFDSEPTFDLNVVLPQTKYLEGFDVALFTCHTSPECSPLSCNSFAATLHTNQHCLFNTFDDAKHAIEENRFSGCGTGPYRIIAIYSII